MRSFAKLNFKEISALTKRVRRSSLTILILIVLFCFVAGNDYYNTHAFSRKTREMSPSRQSVSSFNDAKPIPAWLMSSYYFAGGDNCVDATNVTTSSYTDTGTTVAANNTITNYNSVNLGSPYPGPDKYYKIVLTSPGSIGASMDLSGSTLDGALFLTNACPAGTGNTIPAANTLGNSQDAIGAGVGPEVLPVTALPAGTYYIGIDSYYTGAVSAGSGPYSINITSVGTTAAGVSVSGRVLVPGGRGLSNAIVTIRDQSGVSRQTTTGSRGLFVFEEVEAGQTYVVTVNSRRYHFEPQVISITDQLTGIEFSPSPGIRINRTVEDVKTATKPR